jgi:benzoyl-CoA reductase subunit C
MEFSIKPDQLQRIIKDPVYTLRHTEYGTDQPLAALLCNYVPEELLLSAGYHPVRLIAQGTARNKADAALFNMYCPVARDLLDQALNKAYDSFDAVILSQSCLHMRQAFSAWKRAHPTHQYYYLPYPEKPRTPAAFSFLMEELKRMYHALTQEDSLSLKRIPLEDAWNKVWTRRLLLQEINSYRRSIPSRISGESMYLLVRACQILPVNHSIQLLEHVLHDIKRLSSHKGLNYAVKPRTMVIGSVLSSPLIFQELEGLGTDVVLDDLCTGTRWYDFPRSSTDDIWNAITTETLQRIPCPTKDWEISTRLKLFEEWIKAYHVDIAIQMQVKFCDPHECETPRLIQFFNERNIPFMALEVDQDFGWGQLRTRLEAFMERAEGMDLFYD